MHTATHGIVDPLAKLALHALITLEWPAGSHVCVVSPVSGATRNGHFAIGFDYLNGVLRLRHNPMRMRQQFYCCDVQKSRTFPWRVRISTRRACFSCNRNEIDTHGGTRRFH
jgi:hypothetical protein